MSQDWQQTFNELSALDKVCEAWGANSKESLPVAALVVTLAKRAFNMKARPDRIYTALDHSAFMRIKKNGPESVGYEEAAKTFLRTAEEGDKNMRTVLHFMRRKKARSFLPAIENPAALRQLADKYQLKALKKLLPRA